MARNARLSYGADSDLDPNIIALINRKIESQVDGLIDDRVQRRQLWGPTFKQEGISNLTMTDEDFIIPSPEYGKRTLVFGGTLTAARIVRLPPIPTAWWIVRNNTTFPLTMLTWPTGTEGPTIAPDHVEIVYTDGVIVWRLTGPEGGTGPGGDGTPGGTPTQLQYKVDSTTFGGVTGSSVSAANVGLGGTLNIAVAPKSILLDPVSQAFGYMQFDRAGADLADGDQTGAVVFKGRRTSGTPTQTGYLRSYWSDFFGPTVELGAQSGSVRFAVAESSTLKAATMISGTKYFQVDEGGLRTSEGAAGALLYQDGAPLYLKALDIGLEHQILKVTDIGGGVLRPRWGVASSAGGVPEGIATELQSRDPSGTVFKRVAGSSVSGGDVGLAGNLTFSGADVNRTITFNRTGADLVDGDVVGQIFFNGQVSGSPANYGFIRSLREDSAGGKAVDIGVDPLQRMVISATLGALVLSGSTFIRVQPTGIRLSGGAQGSLFYQDGSPTFFSPLTIGANNTFLRSDSVRPGWVTLTMAHISGTVPISQGGTGLAITAAGEPVNGAILIGNGGGFALNTLSAGTNVIIDNTTSPGHIIINATAGAASQRLDQILNPLLATNFGMAGWQVRFRYDGAVPGIADGGGVLIDSTTNAANGSAGGTLLVVRNVYSDDNAARLFACQIGATGTNYPLVVTHIGAVGMGNLPNIGTPGLADTFRLQIFAPSGNNGLYVSGNVRFTGGTNWGVYYLNGTSQNLATSAAGAGFLKSTGSAPPVFTSISMTDVSGIVPITQGGTGLSTSPIGAGQILIGNGATYALGTITNGGGISVAYVGGNIQLTAVGGSVNDSLDTILDPVTNSELIMGGFQVRFRWNGAVPVGGMLIDSTSNSASGGTLVHIRNTYSDDNAARLLVCQVGGTTPYPLIVTHTGQVGIGLLPDVFNYRLYIGPMPSDTNAVVISGNVKYDTMSQGTNATGDIFYRASTTLLTRKGIGFAGQFLRVTSGLPDWAYIDLSNDSFNGFLQIVDGGTGLTTTPAAGKLLIGTGSAYALGSITNGGGISVAYVGGNIQLTATGGSVNDSLDSVTDPNANADFNMNTRQVKFTWAGSVPGITTVAPAGGGVCIESTSTSAGGGTLLLVRNTYSDNNAARLFACQINFDVDFPLAVTHIGAVGIGQTPNIGTPGLADTYRLQVAAGATFSSGNALYVNGNTRFDITGVALGAIYYRHPTTFNVAGISPAVTAGQVIMSDGSAWAARSITVVGGSILYTGGNLQITVTPGSGSPGGSATQLQFFKTGGGFDGVANSAVAASGQVTLEERSDTQTTSQLLVQKARAANADLTNGYSAGRIAFMGKVGSQVEFGIIEGLYNTGPTLKTLRIGQGLAGSAYRVVALKDNGDLHLETSNGVGNTASILVTPTTITFTGHEGSATTGALYYRNSSGRLSGLDGSTAGQYLRTGGSSTVPAWDAIDIGTSDVSGVLTLAKGGTGVNLSAPGGARILYYDSGSGLVNWLNIDSTLSINTSTDTMSAVAATPTGVLRGSKALSNNTMTTLMEIQFAAGSQQAASGWIDLLFVAKRSSPSADVQSHRRIISFVVSHSRSSVGSYHFKEIALPTTGVASADTLDKRVTQRVATDSASLGFTALSQQINSTTTIELGAVDLQNSIAFDTFQFKILANSPYSLTSLTVFYNIVFNGDAPVTVV